MPPPASSVRAEAAALRSSTAYVQDLETSTVLFAKNENVVRPIASISKLMTAVVVVDANQPMNEMLEITDDDIDGLKHTTSRLRVGTRLSRGDMLHLALMSSENRAANALGRNYPGGLPAFVAAMNAKAQALGMTSTRFIEPTGLSSDNVSSPHDLARLLRAASQRPLIHRYSTDTEYDVEINNRTQTFRNTNLLVRKPDWDIKVSKTGFINEAGECLVMLARINGRDLAIVLLDSQGKLAHWRRGTHPPHRAERSRAGAGPARRLRPAQSPDTERARSDDRALFASGSGGRASPGGQRLRVIERGGQALQHGLGVERADRHRRVQRNATLGLQQLVAQAAHAQEGREIGRLAAVFDQLVVEAFDELRDPHAVAAGDFLQHLPEQLLQPQAGGHAVQAQRTGFRRIGLLAGADEDFTHGSSGCEGRNGVPFRRGRPPSNVRR